MKYGYVRVGAVSPKMKVADCAYNSNQIIKAINNYEEQTQFLVFPELCITGYTCGDLFFQKILIQGAYDGLLSILEETKYTSVVSMIGMPIYHHNKLYNCAVIIQSGKVLGVVPKTHLPNYSEFYEKRWFSPSSKKNEEIELLGQTVPFGSQLLFCSANEHRMNFGIEICEDLWSPIPPSSGHALAGADVIFNLSASNDIVGKYEYRKKLVEQQSSRAICGYVYTSANCNESTTDLVFGGHSMIYENGRFIVESKRFSFEEDCIITEIDIDMIRHDRKKCTVFEGRDHSDYHKVIFDFKDVEIHGLSRYINPHPFVPSSESVREERANEILNIQACGLAKRMKHIGLSKVILGISGGLDSTLALLVCALAFEKLSLDKKNILCVTMPGFGTTEQTLNNAIGLIQSIGATLFEIDITASCLLHFDDIGHDKDTHDVTYENVQARERTQILMDLASKENGMVIGTGDLSELALGWCTYNGDHMSMYGVNASIPKTLVRYLIDYYANYRAETYTKNILQSIIDTPISPELLPSKEGEIVQKTEETIGPYELHDFFLYHFIRHGFTPQKIEFIAKEAFEDQYEQQEIHQWLNVFIKRFFANQFKRSCMPDGPKVGSVSLSPRGDWRMPSDAVSRLWLEE